MTPRPRRLRRSELPVDTRELAKFLLGKIVVRSSDEGRCSGRIVETEAYLIGDAACHAFNGQTRRNRTLFRRRGHAYVYFTYGSCHLLNVSSEIEGVGAGVLIRALEPLTGIELMAQRRGTKRLLDIARGPGRLAEALDIDLRLDGHDLCAPGPLWLADDAAPAMRIGRTTRIGLSREAHRILRFYERGSRYVSGPRNRLS